MTFPVKAAVIVVLSALFGAAFGWFRQTVGATVPGATFVASGLIGWMLAPRPDSNAIGGLIFVAIVALSLLTLPEGVVHAGEIHAKEVAAALELASQAGTQVAAAPDLGVPWTSVLGLIAMPVLMGAAVAGGIGWQARQRG